MLTKLQKLMARTGSDAFAAAALTFAAMAALSVAAPADTGRCGSADAHASRQPAIELGPMELAHGGLPDEGLPPSPGPTDPNGPAQ